MKNITFELEIKTLETDVFFLLDDYVYQTFRFFFRNVILVDRIDFSLSSQVSLLKTRQVTSQYLSMDEYCESTECDRERVFLNIFNYVDLFSFPTAGNTPQKSLLRDSVFSSILKIKGFEDYGYLFGTDRAYVRGFSQYPIFNVKIVELLYGFPETENNLIMYGPADDYDPLFDGDEISTNARMTRDGRISDMYSSSFRGVIAVITPEDVYGASIPRSGVMNLRDYVCTQKIIVRFRSDQQSLNACSYKFCRIITEGTRMELDGILFNFGIIPDIKVSIDAEIIYFLNYKLST